MRTLMLTLLATIAVSTLSLCQETAQVRPGLGYLFYENGVVSSGSHTENFQGAGGGGEFIFRNGLGIGAELAGHSTALATLSLNPYIHLPQVSQSGKWIPFITAGYTAAGNMEFKENWFNFGGGVDYWPSSRIGLRLEARDAVDTNHARLIHQVGFRVGLAWR